MAPSPRPIEKLARPPAIPCTVAIALAASIGWRSGTATAVPTLRVAVADAASPSATYGSGRSPCASPTARPSQPLASICRASSPMPVDGTGVAPMRQNSMLIRSSLSGAEKDDGAGPCEPTPFFSGCSLSQCAAQAPLPQSLSHWAW
jgi:hypothetical protein